MSASKWVTQIIEVDQKHKKRRWWWGALFILFSPWLIELTLVIIVMGFISCTRVALRAGEWRWIRRCSTWAGQVSQVAAPLSPLALGYPLVELFNTTITLAETLKLVDQMVEQLVPYVLVLIHPSAPTPFADTTSLSQTASLLSERLAYLQFQLQQSSRLWPQLEVFLPQVAAGRPLIAKLSLVVGELPQLLSLTQPSQWLVLLQDNTELRPTGGFIDGIGLLRVENGHILEARWLSSAAADAQLKGQVAPPAEMVSVLGETNWYLRDSNWDPDFPSAASKAAWFVSKELYQPVDMVVGVNLSVLGNLLEVVGPVDIPQFGGQITTTNWQANYLQTVQLDTPQRFSPLLAENLWAKIQSLPADRLAELMRQIVVGLETDQIQLWPGRSSAVVAAAGWDGRLGPSTCDSVYPCLDDFVYHIDANIGINKVDSAVSRSLQVSTQIDPQSVTTTYRLTFANLALDPGWPLGEWRNYFRLYLPEAAQVLQVKWGGDRVAGDRLIRATEKGMQKVGMAISVPVGESKELEVVWSQTVPVGPRWHYQLTLPHQSGVAPYPSQLVTHFPVGWWSQAGPAPAVAEPGRFQYNSLIDRTQRFNIDWVPSL